MKKQIKDYYLWQNFARSCDIIFNPVEHNVVSPTKTINNKPISPIISPIKNIPKAVNLQTFMEVPIYKKLITQKIELERSIDLHGYTLEQSYNTLLNFLYKAYEYKIRYVLIITGKGIKNKNSLQINVPKWLKSGDLAKYVNAVERASEKHGGAGALYVRIRKNLN